MQNSLFKEIWRLYIKPPENTHIAQTLLGKVAKEFPNIANLDFYRDNEEAFCSLFDNYIKSSPQPEQLYRAHHSTKNI